MIFTTVAGLEPASAMHNSSQDYPNSRYGKLSVWSWFQNKTCALDLSAIQLLHWSWIRTNDANATSYNYILFAVWNHYSLQGIYANSL